ncbi:MAG: hypothetical protein ACRDJX_02085, partial [Solirubrobacteraceae bacterium]
MLVSLCAVAAAQASFGVEKFIAVNCKAEYIKCASTEAESTLGPTEPKAVFPKESLSVEEAEKEGFVQAGGRVPFGITDFQVNVKGEYPDAAPEGGPVSHVRVDVAPGLATAPVAVPTCSAAEFGNEEALPGTGFYEAPTCKAETEIGIEQVTLYLGPNALGAGVSDLPVAGKVYNLEQPKGLASYYGAAIKFPIAVSKGSLELAFSKEPEGHLPEEDFKGGKAEREFTETYLEEKQYYVHSFVKGSVEWGKEAKGTDRGDYHDYFEVEASTALPLI